MFSSLIAFKLLNHNYYDIALHAIATTSIILNCRPHSMLNRIFNNNFHKNTPSLSCKRTEDCQYSCPELHACVNASIWCDGRVHCPSGYDESFIHCSRILRLPAEVLAVFGVFLILLCCAGCLYVHRFVGNSISFISFARHKLKFTSCS